MQELMGQWGLVASRGAIALLLAAALWFSPVIVSNLLLQALLFPFILLAFSFYILADSGLVVALFSQMPASVPLRKLLIAQSFTEFIIGTGLLTIFSVKANPHWLIVLAILRSALTGAYELAVAAHLHRHIRDERAVFSIGTGSLAFSAALLIFSNGDLRRLFNWLVAYAIYFGATVLWFGFRLRRVNNSQQQWSRAGVSR